MLLVLAHLLARVTRPRARGESGEVLDPNVPQSLQNQLF